MTPTNLLKTAIIPALQALESFGIKDTLEARRFLLAIALQETNLEHRRQVAASGNETGPASSFWQFEQPGACVEVLSRSGIAKYMRAMCEDFNVTPTPFGLWTAMQYHDIIAACAARLLVYTLPGALPTLPEEGWQQYTAAWRPGKPHRNTWDDCWQRADLTVRGAL